MAREIYILAGGGTGGHICPGIAVAEAIVRLSGDAGLVFACSDRPIDRAFLDDLDFAIVPQPVRPVPRSARQMIPFYRAWRRSRRLGRRMIADLKPSAVLGLGGFAAGPVVREARRAGIRSAMLNPDAVPGRANRYLARHVQAVFTQFESTSDALGGSCRDKIHLVGCPVRSSISSGASSSEAMNFFNLKPGLKVLLVLGGSQGAANINAAISGLGDDLTALAGKWQILHIAGPDQVDTFAGGGIHVTRLPFCDEMGMVYSVADLVLCRGGASTIGELLSGNNPAVIMPYPYHRDKQQYQNARSLTESGAAEICEDYKDRELNIRALRDILLPIMKDDSLLGSMQSAAKECGNSNAAEEVARWMIGH